LARAVFWVGLFVVLSRQALLQFGRKGLVVIPILWLGLEFFRSELYYLRFSWLTPGFVFSGTRSAEVLSILGVYGIGGLLFAIVAGSWAMPLTARSTLVGLAIVTFSFLGKSQQTAPLSTGSRIEVAGVQMEFPSEDEVLAELTRLTAARTNANLLVLSEYTFPGPLPEKIKTWCRDNKRYVIVGAHDPAGEDYFNTAFVIGPDGHIVFKQAKSVPIQFFKDGLPAREQKVWASPWGKIGMGVCYDLSYRRVMDRLVQQGCQALILPTMDVAEWGERQHRLHGRVAPMRAAEFGLPIFRLCSSGISQAVDRSGSITATAPYPGEKTFLSASIILNGPGRMPLDHWLGPLAVGITAALIMTFLLKVRRKATPSL
jgi:apolipoprotein N-acyltransferase